jgi:hypothetical protein
MQKIFGLGILMHLIFFSIMNMGTRGEAGSGGGADDKGGNGGGADDKKSYTQQEIDNIVKTRIAREREKFADYDELRKFKDDHTRQTEAQKQKDLEEQRKYNEVLAERDKRLAEAQRVIQEKDNNIKTMRVRHSLISELNAQNAYADDAVELISGSAILRDDGTIAIKGRDSNGIETEFALQEGIKRFLQTKPHLVRAGQGGGSGTGGNAGSGTPPLGGSGEDLMTLNRSLSDAMVRGDRKAINEIKGKINQHMANKGISRVM